MLAYILLFLSSFTLWVFFILLLLYNFFFVIFLVVVFVIVVVGVLFVLFVLLFLCHVLVFVLFSIFSSSSSCSSSHITASGFILPSLPPFMHCFTLPLTHLHSSTQPLHFPSSFSFRRIFFLPPLTHSFFFSLSFSFFSVHLSLFLSLLSSRDFLVASTTTTTTTTTATTTTSTTSSSLPSLLSWPQNLVSSLPTDPKHAISRPLPVNSPQRSVSITTTPDPLCPRLSSRGTIANHVITPTSA